MEIFTRKLLQEGTVSAGDALRAAKQRYITGLSTVSAYEEKSSLQFTFYGLPQYRIDLVDPQRYLPPDPFDDPDGELTVVVDGNDYTFAVDRMNTASGTYWTADGDAQASPWRPILPRVVFPLAPGGEPVHGALLTGGAFDSETIDPVVTLPTTEWEQNATESQMLPPSFWPAELATVNTVEADGQLVQTLVVIPAQFRPTGSSGENVTGTHRLFRNVSFELQRSSSDDWLPPQITAVDLEDAGGGNVAVSVSASDPGGIARVVVFRINGELTMHEAIQSGGDYTVNVPWTTEDKLIVQVRDGAGNVATYTGKGAGLSLIAVDAGPDQSRIIGEPVTFTANVTGFAGLVKPVFYTWDFGDGTTESGILTTSDFTVTHAYASTLRQVKATLKVTDSDGGIGVDAVNVTFVYKWGGFVSPLSNAQYEIGRNIPVKFVLLDYDDNPVSDAKAEVWLSVDSGGPSKIGDATYANGVYIYVYNTSLLIGAKAGTELVFWAYPDDGTRYAAIPVTLK
ncbi:MAG: hypothetical protein A2147_04440 [Chloroflexi bacterium RBG_16_57_8]|nr:MAG: hypothetical protein A2147_04440 [Chloroflexi bacterium RBG_16_57_8]